MPHWLIYHPPGTFETESAKEALAKDIVPIYTDGGLPAFYVVVQFIKVPVSDTYVGGEQRAATPFVRITIAHVAINMTVDLPNDMDRQYRKLTNRIDRILKPHITAKGFDLEYTVQETERRLWKINGLVPPPWRSEEEKLWVRENRPVAYPGSVL
ncbi:hypothetical protein LTR36_002449 [Oleoguttula mirabilis]|uniref:Tautomerase cis-CaaD-like domain-containing protein n=1 Tax=Oleoguttula mirabilis TaxID=1507867 RepID=A0AAV9JKT9_9PEZI|nr:hypothetical protein LTR36_002449 [Oleoguttula mirabilis]